MLLLHGNPSRLEHFDPILPAIGAHARVIAYDHPGFGRSTWFADGTVTLERSARVAVAVLDALGVSEPVDVIGHSHGGMVAIALAALAPERVRSLVMIGTGASPAPPGYRLLRAFPGIPPRAPLALAGLAIRWSFAPDAVPAGFVDQEVAELRARPEVLRAMVQLALDDPGTKATAYARQVRVPALVVHGRGDGLVSMRHARSLGHILRARVVKVPGGHMVHIAHPERVAPTIAAWLASLAGAPG
jgi:pimeloyl-ACP methyl ester carboxylesterase